MKKIVTAITVAFAIVLSGCATSHKASSYTSSLAMAQGTVEYATVVSVREVEIDNGESGAGRVGGAVIGGVAGSNVGSGRGSIIGAVGGAIIGGIGGALADRFLNKETGLEIVYKMEESGDEFITVQAAEEGVTFQGGDRVRVIRTGNNVRLVKVS